jgi:hypothetical protein
MLTEIVKENALLKVRKCPECGFDGRFTGVAKRRCGICNRGSGAPERSVFSSITARLSTFLLVCIATIAGFYASLVYSAAPLTADQRNTVNSAIDLLEAKGFSDEVFLLRNAAAFRSNDNWLNASVEKENAYAATNFPFGIVTLYPEFFERTSSNVERAAILLHETKHIQGDDEKAAYEYIWRNRKKLGWDGPEFNGTEMWINVRKQTAEYSPNLFICELNVANDCTDRPRLPSDILR